jgi:hypothetical protein
LCLYLRAVVDHWQQVVRQIGHSISAELHQPNLHTLSAVVVVSPSGTVGYSSQLQAKRLAKK